MRHLFTGVIRRISLSLFLIVIMPTAHAVEPSSIKQSSWDALRSGTAVAIMRHAMAPGIGDPPEFNLENCTTQRNLSDAGQVQAKAIG